MAEIHAVAGAKLFIGGVLESKAADFVAADFTSQTWVEIDGWQTMGAIGDTATEITGSLINRGRDYRLKGTFNAGTMENTFVILADDDGQIAARAAAKTRSNYAFKIEWPEEAGIESSNFIALVMSDNKSGGEANTANLMTVSLGINSNIVEVLTT